MELDPLRSVARVAATMGLRVVLIGALARQLVFDLPLRGTPSRATLDIDTMVRVSTFQEFEELAARLEASGEFRRINEHRFAHTGGGEVDVIPFGGVANAAGDLVWPRGRVMSLAGLDSADSHAKPLEEVGMGVRVINLPNLVALKLFAYRDRHNQNSKDIADLVLILTNASAALGDRMYTELEGEVIQGLDYDQLGPYLLGMDVARVVTPDERASLGEILGKHLLTPPEYRTLSQHAKDDRLERLIASFEAFRTGLRTL